MEVRDTDVAINFTSWQGISDFAAYKLGKRKTADANMSRAKEIVQAGKLQGVQLEEDGGVRKRRALCQGSDGGAYEVTAAVSAAGDWADLTCACPAAEKQALCKHGLALLLHGVPLPADEPDAPPPQPAPPTAPAAAPGGGGGRRKLPASMLQAPAAAAKPKAVPAKPPAAKKAAEPKPRAAPRAKAKAGPKAVAKPGAQPPRRMSGARMLALSDEELVEACLAVVQAAAGGRGPTGAAPSAAGGQHAADRGQPPPGKATLLAAPEPEPAAAADAPAPQPCPAASEALPAAQAAAPVAQTESLFSFEALFGSSDPAPASLATGGSGGGSSAPPQQQQQQPQPEPAAHPLEPRAADAAAVAAAGYGGMDYQEAETQPVDLTLDSD